MDTTASPLLEDIEWLDLWTYLDRECEAVWRMQFRVPENVLAFGNREQRLNLFRRETLAADQLSKEIKFMDSFASRIGVCVKTANGPNGSWQFQFSTSDRAEPIHLKGLGEAFDWLRMRSETLRGVSP